MGLFNFFKKRPKGKTHTGIPSAELIPHSQYVETGHSITRADGKTFTDEEVPFLIQRGYENIMQKSGMYDGEVLDLSFIVKMNENKHTHTTLPSYNELMLVPPQNHEITSTDIFFLKYIDGRLLENPAIAQFWYYDYNLDYSDEIKKLIANGLLTIQNVNLEKLKVDELKDILRNFSLPLSGKKQDLQKRIYDNVSSDDLSIFLGHQKHYFCATEEGKLLIKFNHESATKNLELENSCIDLILQNNFETAYMLIQDFKHSTPAESHNPYSTYDSDMDKLFLNIMHSRAFYYTLETDRKIESKLRAAIVFCHMYGSGQDSIKKIIKRIYIENNIDYSNDAKNIISGRLL